MAPLGKGAAAVLPLLREAGHGQICGVGGKLEWADWPKDDEEGCLGPVVCELLAHR